MKLVASRRSSSCSSRWSRRPGVLGTRRRKELGTAELGGTRARVWGGVARWGLGSQRRGALYRAAQAILGRRAPDGRPAGNLGLTGTVVALRGRRNWRAGLAGQRKQRRGCGRVRAQAVSERGRHSRGLKRRGEWLAGPGWERARWASREAWAAALEQAWEEENGLRAGEERRELGLALRGLSAGEKGVGRRVGLLGCLVGLGWVLVFFFSISKSISYFYSSSNKTI